MRIWDIPPAKLCLKHLLGEHRELHALYSILQHNKKGYRSHPETKRWEGKLPALKLRHGLLEQEMKKRGYNHLSPLVDMGGSDNQDELITSIIDQERLLTDKKCDCLIE